jgi:hypothetical protein
MRGADWQRGPAFTCGEGLGPVSRKPCRVATAQNPSRPTTSAAWWNTNNTYPAHTYTFDIAGNVTTDKDGNGHTTSYGYSDNYSDGVNRGNYAHVTSTTNALGQ